MFLYYIRHGDPIYNPDSLTPLGQRQANVRRKPWEEGLPFRELMKFMHQHRSGQSLRQSPYPKY